MQNVSFSPLSSLPCPYQFLSLLLPPLIAKTSSHLSRTLQVIAVDRCQMSWSGSEDGTADTKNGTKQEMTNGPTKVEPKEPQTDKRAVSLRCLICEAQATGFHFDAQSCSGTFLFFLLIFRFYIFRKILSRQLIV